MIDSHAHLYFDRFDDDRDEVIERARQAGVEHFVVVGIDLETSIQARDLARVRDDISATAGFHPNDLTNVDEDDWTRLDRILTEGGYVGIGETGLDYYWKHTSAKMQKEGLRRHLDAARRHDLPVVIHCRDAWSDLLDFLETEAHDTRGIMHCFSAGPEEVERSLALDYEISFAGPLTYPRNETLREAARTTPLDRLHIETDCPFLPPQSHRGRRNEPALMVELVETLSRLKGVDRDEIARNTARNTRRLFTLDVSGTSALSSKPSDSGSPDSDLNR